MKVLFLLILSSSLTLAQGSLNAPGAPAPTMKTLDQIEARTAIPPAPVPVAGPHFTISASGSYFLTGNIAVTSGDAIRIDADNVTLDLSGFTIKSTLTGSATGSAVSIIGSRTRVIVRNGSITSGTNVPPSGSAVQAGFSFGIRSTATVLQSVVEAVNVLGVGETGIYLPNQSIVRNCNARDCGTTGIFAQQVSDCVADNCHGDAITAVNARNSSGTSTSAIGLNSVNASNCNGTTLQTNGLYCSGNATNCSGTTAVFGGGLVCGGNATNCTGKGTGSFGVGLSCTGNATNCIGISSSATGLSCSGNATNCTGLSSSTSGNQGISVTGTASFCRGLRDGGVAIQAAIAIGCTVEGTGTVTGQKFLGTP